MTPAVAAARRAKIPFRIHEYAHDPAAASYGDEAVAALGLSAEQVFKTLIAATPTGEPLMAVVPVARRLDLKALARAAGAKRVLLASEGEAERVTGYLVGGISPLGQKRRLRAFVDASAADRDELWISAGRRGLELSLRPADLVRLLGATLAPLARD